MPLGIERLNSLSDGKLSAALSKCCGSSAWVRAMASSRPFASEAHLRERAREVWRGLSHPDYLEAFSHHPRIGDRVRAGGWESREQSGTQSAAQATLSALRSGNEDYEKKFGHVFLIFATGKTADEMLAQLRMRLRNSPDQELQNAAHEQSLITDLRLSKLLQELEGTPS